jgi:oligopeptidase A
LSESDDNPLLDQSGLPRFDAISPSHVEPGIRALLTQLGGAMDALEAASGEPGVDLWAEVVEALERIHDTLGFSWGVVGHLMGVQNSDALRQAHEAVQGEMVAFGLRLGQSRPLYDALTRMREGGEWNGLEPAQQRIVESLLRDARHAGVGLDGEARARFNELQTELAETATQFSNHVLDATKAFSLTLTDPAEAQGLPASLRSLAAQAARDAGAESASPDGGPWRITLDAPSFVPFLQHSPRADLRERLYRAYTTRASEGELDNAPLIEKTLRLRREQAALLGYESYAELSLSSKMAPGVDAALELLEQLRGASFAAAEQELAELTEFAREQGGAPSAELALWDVAYWSERLREHRYDYSEEDLRPYFPMSVVLEGLFALSERLFGVTIRAADGEASTWHADVRFFRVYDESDSEIAAFFLDPYSRPEEKRGGAWMDECVGRSRLLAGGKGDVRLPVAYLVCNQTPPVEGRDSQMSFQEVTTLFHEFGHGLQHMLTRVDYGLASGIRNVEWDAVELPSQFMENWCYHWDTLRGLTKHAESGEPIPRELFDKLESARTYRAASDMLRQLYFGFTDLELHHRYDPDGSEDAFGVQRRIAAKTTVMSPLPEDRFLCSFGHIFAGGYAAGYYGYKWAEVLSADAFEAFEEVGLDDAVQVAETGRRYRETVLALGGSRSPMEVFSDFRGRAPRADALLRHSGLVAA